MSNILITIFFILFQIIKNTQKEPEIYTEYTSDDKFLSDSQVEPLLSSKHYLIN